MAQVTLSWTDNSNREFGFEIQRKVGTGEFSVLANTLPARDPAPVAVSYVDEDVEEDTEYTYRVRAFNAGGFSGFSNEFTISTPAPAPAGPLMFWRFEDTPGFLLDEGTKGYDWTAVDVAIGEES